jgi:opacity protein-like surface antigen
MKKICLVSVMFFLLISNAFAETINLPQTGQTKCYDTVGAEISCAGTGQDGNIRAGVAWPNLRFTVNADTTTADNLTGLVWAPDGNVMKTRDSGWDTDGTANDGRVTWQHALDYVAKLNAENTLAIMTGASRM